MSDRLRAALTDRWSLLAGLAVFVVVSALVIPRMHVDGSARLVSYELQAGTSAPDLRTNGTVSRNVYGFVVDPYGRAAASFTASGTRPAGQHLVLFVSAGGGPDVATRVTLLDASGKRHLLGQPERWVARRVDVSSIVRSGRFRIEFTATNSGPSQRLFADQVRVAAYPASAVPDAGRLVVAVWVALAMLLGLLAIGRVRRHLQLAATAGLAAFLVWPSVGEGAFRPLPSSGVWQAATSAEWFDLDHGLVSGTFGPESSLAVQLFHALTPLTGTGAVGARSASLIVGLMGITALYVLAVRVAGPVGAAGVSACMLLSDPFRLSLTSGDAITTLVLAATLFLIAAHRVLVRPDRTGYVLLGAAGAAAVLAEPTWWPGVLAAIVLLAVRYVPAGRRLPALVVGLTAFALVSLPSRVSVAHQSSGDSTADVTLRTTYARNVEFLGGRPVGLGSYLFGDHSLSVVAGGALSGAYDGLSAAAARPETKVVGVLAFLIELVGVVLLLFLPRVRLLVVIPALLALVPWFLVSRGAVTAFAGQAGFWPALVLGGGVITYVAWEAARARFAGTLLAETLSTRSLPQRRGTPQPG